VARASGSGGGGERSVSAPGGAGFEVSLGRAQARRIRTHDVMGWRRAAVVMVLAGLMLMCVGAWTREARGELSVSQLRECILLTAVTFVYALGAIFTQRTAAPVAPSRPPASAG